MFESQVNHIAFEVVESFTKAKYNEEINLEKLIMHYKLKLTLHCRPTARISGIPEDPGSIPDNGTFFI